MKHKNYKKILLLSLLTFALSKENVNAKELDSYLNKQIEYYKENPDMIDYDLKKDILIEDTNNISNIELSYSVSNLDNQIGDFVYVNGIGNTSSDGSGDEINQIYYASDSTYRPMVLVGIKSGSAYPFAVAKYYIEDNTLGGIVGWFKDNDVITRVKNNYDVIDAPIYSSLRYKDKANSSYTRLNSKVAIKVYYSDKNLSDGYFFSNKGYYVKKDSKTTSRQTLNEEQMKTLSKYKIKNK